MITPTLRRIQSARTTLLLDNPFFGVLALQLHIKEDDSCDTAWTDGMSMGFSPAFVATLSQDELVAVLAHEVMHCACGHMWRRDSRDMQKWNMAADYAINPILQAANFKLPANCLLNQQFAGQSAEWIYDRLPAGQQQGQGQGQGQPDNGMGEVRDAPSDSQSTEADWQQMTRQAAKMAQAQGKLPAGMARSILEQTEPKVDWRSALRRYVQETCKADYSWTKPNSRYMVSGLYLPALHSVAMGRIVVAVDTSGSIDDVLLAQFAAEVQTIADELQPSSITVYYCDSHINHMDTFERGEAVTITPHGGGGTAFEPVFEAVAASGEEPAVLVYLTDLDGSFPNDAPDYPVIWCQAARGYKTDVPFGDLIACY
jgi:predicted metal-dependent peptidase